MKKLMTLCIVQQPPQILLGLKKRGFGVGRWNGFGGKVEEGESIEQATRRELYEEAGITAGELELMGQLDFEFSGHGEILAVSIFKTREYSGELRESEEMKPQWFSIDEIPFNQMWPDDVYWIPMFLKGDKFSGRFLFGEQYVILEQEIKLIGKRE